MLIFCPLVLGISPAQQKLDTLKQLKSLLAQVRDGTDQPSPKSEFEVEIELTADKIKPAVLNETGTVQTPGSLRRQIRQMRWRKLRSE